MAAKKTSPAASAPTGSRFNSGLVTTIKRWRFNPIRGLTPDRLSRELDSFAVGCLTSFAMTADAIRRRDDVINPALTKREKAPARRNWSIQLVEGLDDSRKAAAEEHKEALQFFFDNLDVTSALEQDQRGGFRLLVRQMMQAVSMRYSVHETVWQPQIDPLSGKPRLTAQLIHAPLRLFEATTGRLRFLSQVYGYEGQPMAAGEWLVTVGDGIIEPLAIAYMFKQMSLKDWVSYNDKFGMPGVHGKTDAAEDSPEWKALETAVEEFSQNWSAVTNRGADISLIETQAGTTLPFPPLVERMDRAIATICRGADLSTMSAGSGEGQGASVQGEETDLLEQDDALMINEALEPLSEFVINYLFGSDTPLAYLQIAVPKRKTTDDTIKKFAFLRDSGVPIGQEFARQELSVPAPAEDEEVLQRPAAPAFPPPGEGLRLANAASAVNDLIFRKRASRAIMQAKADAMAPLADRLREIIGMDDETEQDAALVKWQADLPGFLRTHAITPEELDAWMRALSSEFVSGAAEGRAALKGKVKTAAK